TSHRRRRGWAWNSRSKVPGLVERPPSTAQVVPPSSLVSRPTKPGTLEREFHAQPRLRRWLVAPHLAISRIEVDRVAVGVLVHIVERLEPHRPPRRSHVQPVERSPRGHPPPKTE